MDDLLDDTGNDMVSCPDSLWMSQVWALVDEDDDDDDDDEDGYEDYDDEDD